LRCIIWLDFHAMCTTACTCHMASCLVLLQTSSPLVLEFWLSCMYFFSCKHLTWFYDGFFSNLFRHCYVCKLRVCTNNSF
jgi:hypothetical protein